ncbi:MAG: mechanosensitive ion channel family protein [Halanaerobiaceae bacterium]
MNSFSQFFNGNNNMVSTTLLWSIGLKVLYSILIIIAAKILIKLGNKFIEKVINNSDNADKIRRKNTLMLLLKSILKYVIYFFFLLIILSLFGIPVASLIAGAGILGLAIGFGAQSLVKDIINGFFIIFENQFSVGDYVEAAGKEGVVEELGLRTTNLRDFGGQIHIIPNGEIGQITNHSGNMRVLVDVGITYEASIEQATEELNKLCRMISEEKAEVLREGPKVLGVQDLAGSSVVIRIMARVKPMQQWIMTRYIRQRVKEHLDEVGIDIAYPHIVLLPKEGQAIDIKNKASK